MFHTKRSTATEISSFKPRISNCCCRHYKYPLNLKPLFDESMNSMAVIIEVNYQQSNPISRTDNSSLIESQYAQRCKSKLNARSVAYASSINIGLIV